MQNEMYDVVIIGAGPAGISAALYAARARLSAAVIYSGPGALEKAEKIQNYYGLPAPVSGTVLFENGLAQARALGVALVKDEVLGVAWDGVFAVRGKTAQLRAAAVIIATGSARKKAPIKNLERFEGRGVSYCAVCDAFFYRGKTVAVLGNAAFALHEAEQLAPVVGEVVIFTNGKPPAFDNSAGFEIVETPIAVLEGGETLQKAVFDDGSERAISGLFVALGTAGAADFARAAGAVVENGQIAVGEKMNTSVPGLFAAGDCTGGLLQVAKAVADGATAGMAAIDFVRAKKKEEVQ